MRTNGEHNKRSIKSLLRHWQAMAKILIGFGARLSRHQRANTAQAYAMTEEVELAARAALVEIQRDIRDAHENGAPPSDEENAGLRQLSAIAAGFLALAFLAQNIRQDLAGRGPSGFAVQHVFAWLGLGEHAPHWRAPVFAPPILDPGCPVKKPIRCV